jgi:epoxide hydrolase-like predicted phosphatase
MNDPSSVQAIVFDCFGVLTADTWRAFCDSLPQGPAVGQARELNHQYDAGLITREAFLNGIYELTGRRPVEVEKLLDNEITKNTLLFDYIRELKQHYKIGLLSNVGTPWITDYFLTEQEQALFDEMVFSFQVGMTKPDPRIFQLVCERLQVEPAQAVMVDDIDRYCEAAREVGMKAVVYENFQQFRRDIAALLDGTAADHR